MRNLVFWLLLSVITSTTIYAQGNGNGNGGCGNNGNGNGGYGNNGNGNGNGGYGNNGNGNGNNWGNNNPWASNWPQWVITWLENGGQVPLPLAVAVIHEARSWGQQNFGLNQGQMLVKYLQGQLTIDYVPTAPPTLTFRVSFGGGTAIILLQDI